MKTIKIQTKSHYGIRLHYPVCDLAKMLALLRNPGKRLNPTFRDIDLLLLEEIGKELGFKLEFIPWDLNTHMSEIRKLRTNYKRKKKDKVVSKDDYIHPLEEQIGEQNEHNSETSQPDARGFEGQSIPGGETHESST